MKRYVKNLIILCGLVFIGVFTASAQTSKSTWLLGGSTSFQATNGSSVFVLTPNIGYFVKDKLAIGAEASVVSSGGFTSWSIGPYARKYFGTSDKGSFFGQAGIAVGGVSNSSDVDLWIPVKLGYAVFLNRNIALEFAAGYTISLADTPGVFTMGVGFQLHLGK